MPGARIYVVIYGLAMPAPRPVCGVNFASPQVDRVGQIVGESNVPPFVGCYRFPVLQLFAIHRLPCCFIRSTCVLRSCRISLSDAW